MREVFWLKLAVIGSDARMEMTARLLAAEGCEAKLLSAAGTDDWQDTLRAADGLLLPYPWSVRDGKVPGWQHGGVEALLRLLPRGALLMAGMGLVGTEAERLAGEMGHRLRYYAEDAAFAGRNAEISAEAAICAAMSRTGCMLDEQRVLLMGYGLFGKAIAWRLGALGAKVWVAARRKRQRREAAADGFVPVPLEGISALAPGIDLVLNTIPAVVLGRQELSFFPEHTIFLELASPPYGIDLSAAAEAGCNVSVLPGLPAAYAPLSAARALKNAVLRQCKEEGK